MSETCIRKFEAQNAEEELSLRWHLACPGCSASASGNGISCKSGADCQKDWLNAASSKIPKFTDGATHANFGLQWQLFSKVQLDSYNGSRESEARLLIQSRLKPEDFFNKTILELGCGNGRFTELFLKYGARVVGVDYSDAVFANFKNNKQHIDNGNLLLVQADIFRLPLRKASFDMVVCYGVIQHTGDNLRALSCISGYVRLNGLVLVDIYALSLRHYNPILYLTRFFVRLARIDNDRLLSIVKRFVNRVFDIQVFLLRFLRDKEGVFKLLRYAVNRSPNSVYGIHLWLDGKISREVGKEWCILDTFDAWGARYDHPVTGYRWKAMLSKLRTLGLSTLYCGESGQGHVAVLQRLR